MNSFVRRPPRRRPDQRSGGGMRRPSNGGFRTNRPQNIEHSFNNNGNNGYRNNGSAHGAHKLVEKYNNLAREALASGDIILAENYYQHADHYIRIAPPQHRSERNGSESETPTETTEIINKIPGVHLDEPQEEAAANSKKADGNS
jgi:hypothetical protein